MNDVVDAAEEARTFAAIPSLPALIDSIARLIPFDRGEEVSILDLGSGSGMLAATLLARFPRAHITLVEESDALQTSGRERLAADAARTEWVAGAFARIELPRSFRAVVSLLRVHAVEEIARRALYRSIYGALVPDGILLIADHARPPTTGLATLYAKAEGEASPPPISRGLLLANELPWLTTVGFRDVDVHYKNLDYAVYGGRRPAAADFTFDEPKRGR